jgi:hypothetical protein
MASKKTYALCLLIVFFSISPFVSAKDQDYLYVFGSYDGSQYFLNSVEQRVLQSSDARIGGSGTYEMRLYKSDQLLSHNFLEIGAPSTAEAIGPNNTFTDVKQKNVDFGVILPLDSSLNVSQARVQLLKSGQVVAERSLAEIPTQVLAAQTNSVLTAESLATGSSYVFHLYLNNTGQLVIDRDFQFTYDVEKEQFVQTSVGQFPYRATVFNIVGETAASVRFDVQTGKLTVMAPYVPDAQKVVFYDNQNQPALTISVSDSSFCNDDGICNANRGEDSLSCPKDCKQSLSVNDSTVTTPKSSSGILSGIVYAIIGLILIGFLWWVFKRRASSGALSSSSANFPLPPSPTAPSPQNALPTPPAPPSPQKPI